MALTIRTLGSALEDYTVDERGDVGSWVRIAAIKSIGNISVAYFESSDLRQTGSLRACLSPDLYLECFAALLKQGSERLDTVRREAGAQISRLLKIHQVLRDDASVHDWTPPDFDKLVNTFGRYVAPCCKTAQMFGS